MKIILEFDGTRNPFNPIFKIIKFTSATFGVLSVNYGRN
jgi:hypothetical protein